MTGSVLNLPGLASKPFGLFLVVSTLSFSCALLAFLRFGELKRVSGAVFLGLAFLCLSFAVIGAGLGGGLAGAGAVLLLNAWTAKPGEEKNSTSS